MLSEPQVKESVERYLSRPRFSGFYTRREVEVQMGSTRRSADIALFTDSSSPRMIVIVECKGEGIARIEGIDQLKSYLSASATELGIFANTDNPNNWHYVKNLGSNEFADITRADFENRVDELRPPPEPQSRRDLMNSNKQRARTALFELKEAVLTILLEAKAAEEGHIQPGKIRERLGIPKVEEPPGYTNTLIRGVLYHLQDEELVQFETNSGWQVTETAALLLDES